MLYRHTLRGRDQVAVWEDAHTGPFDTAGKGKSALLAAAYRSIKAEVYGQTEDQVIAVFHDFEKFFDTIDIPILIEKALELQFPVLDLALTIMQHLAPRVIQCDAFCSKPILVNRSILAGCRHSVALTRVLMLTRITKLNIEHPLVATDVCVDDTAMLTYGERQESLDNITRAVIDFANFAHSMHLKLSHKGVIVAKIHQDCKKLAFRLKQKGIKYQVNDSTRDLGISFANSPKGKRQLINQRTKNANKTGVKIQSLSSISRKAKLLFSGSGFPKFTWGFQVSGMSRMQWLKLETAAANITGIKKGRCRYPTLCIAYGPNGHPFARGIRELFVLV